MSLHTDRRRCAPSSWFRPPSLHHQTRRDGARSRQQGWWFSPSQVEITWSRSVHRACWIACVSTHQAFGCPYAMPVSQVSLQYLRVCVLIPARAPPSILTSPWRKLDVSLCVPRLLCIFSGNGHGVTHYVRSLVVGRPHASVVIKCPQDVWCVIISMISIAQLSAWSRPESPIPLV